MQRQNDLTGLVEGIFSQPGMYGHTETIATPYTFAMGVQYTPLSLDRIALTYGYAGYGLVQTLIDIPVEDALRGGVEIETDELDVEELELLHTFRDENEDDEAVKETLKWCRLYGGGALLTEAGEEDPRTPFNPETLTPDSALRFIAADRWELVLTGASVLNINQPGLNNLTQQKINIPYMYYTVPINDTRVKRVIGKKAPSFLRVRLQGWGMSELERCLRDINAFVKFQNVIFELIDEKKLDIFKIQQFNQMLASAEGTALIQKRIQLNSVLKNYKNATAMDVEDDFVQKELTMAGIADIYQELRQNLSASLGIPEAKLFGQSSSGFSSGQDTIENYNALVESGVRATMKPLLKHTIDLRCQQLFGFVPAYKIKFKPLRVLSEPEEEAVLTSRQNRALTLYDRQLFTAQELMESLDKDKLLNVCTEVQQGLREVAQAMPGEDGSNDGKGDNKENALNELLKNRANAQRERYRMQDQKILAKLKRAA